MEVVTKVVKVYKVSVCSEEYESLNMGTEMGHGTLTCSVGRNTTCQTQVGRARCTKTGRSSSTWKIFSSC